MNYLSRFRSYLVLFRWHQPIGLFLLLWPALWALWIAHAGMPQRKIVVLFVLGAVLTRTLGCVVNDIADRNFDGLVARTRHRPLASGQIRVIEAIILFVVLTSLAFWVVLQFNLLTIKLAGVGLVLICIYPFSKRYTYWPQVLLGLVFGGWSVLMAFAAEKGRVPIIAWPVFIASFLWCLAYDTIYAMVDRADDSKFGIKSSALALGRYDTLFIGLMSFSFVSLLIGVGIYLNMQAIYYLMLVCAGMLLLYQQYLIMDRKPEDCFKAFLNNAWVGGIIFLGFVLGLPAADIPLV